MGVREHVSDRQAASHVVQFFDADETRHEAVASFLSQGYLSGGSLILIARPLNSTAALDRLEQAGAPIPRDVQSGRVTVLNATDTLRRISRRGSPDARMFEDIVGARVAGVSRDARVYAYNEMVDLLAERGDFTDAALLESFWNRLLSLTPHSLLCGYAAAHFVSGAEHALREICAAHSTVRAEGQDPLASWLLQQTQ
jgi:hypothetical protein